MTHRIGNPFPLFFENGETVNNGALYIGEPGKDPQLFPVAVYWDEALTLAAAQPLKVQGGTIVNGANAAFAHVDGESHSIRLRNSDGGVVFFAATAKLGEGLYQPADADLTAIAALTTTEYGRALLTLANQAALRTATGIPDPLPLAGGTVTGNIVRSAAGAHFYWNDPALVSGRFFVVEAGATDPTTQIGHVVFELEP